MIMSWLKISVSSDECVYTAWKKWGRKFKKKRQQNIAYATRAGVIYFIWKARNRSLWHQVVPCPDKVVKKIQQVICCRVRKSIIVKRSTEEVAWFENLVANCIR